jgi:ankyrin repeat protein
MAMKENPSEVSKFYLACRNGDVEFVRNYLLTRDDTKDGLNQWESSVKSTPLHAASYHGHGEIVKLLIEHGCDRSQTNSDGLTAYEEAANDEILQLFKRPSGSGNSRRFHDGTVDDFNFVKRPEKQVSIYQLCNLECF